MLNVSAHAAETPVNLTILADPSLVLPLTQLARNYAHDHGVTVTVVMTDGHDIAQQIGQGLDANVLVTANQPLLETLNEQGLTDVFGDHVVARTQLALAAPTEVARRGNLAKHISFTAILYAQPNLPVYVAPPATLEGARAQTLIHSNAYSATLAARTVTLDDREAIFHRLANEPGFALLLATDVLREPSLQLLTVLPEDAVKPVDYRAVLIAGDAVEPSRDFIRYLQSAETQQVFAHYGFQPPLAN